MPEGGNSRLSFFLQAIKCMLQCSRQNFQHNTKIHMVYLGLFYRSDDYHVFILTWYTLGINSICTPVKTFNKMAYLRWVGMMPANVCSIIFIEIKVSQKYLVLVGKFWNLWISNLVNGSTFRTYCFKAIQDINTFVSLKINEQKLVGLTNPLVPFQTIPKRPFFTWLITWCTVGV